MKFSHIITSMDASTLFSDSSLWVKAIAFAVSLTAVIIASLYLLRRRSPTEVKTAPVKLEKDESEKSDIEKKTEDKSELKNAPPGLCPFNYFEHIPSEVKKAEQQKIQKSVEQEMSDDDKAKEREVQRQQMEAIFKLMQGQEETFGISNLDEMNEQMKMYSVGM